MMRQLLCDLSSGALTLSSMPVGRPAPGKLCVRVHHSVISTGTEHMLLSFGTSSWIERARAQPERVRQVLQRIQAQGVIAAAAAVKGRLETPLPLGYACAGVVIAVGEGVRDFAPGDRVACNGPHADVVHVSDMLCAHVPDAVTLEQAALTTLASIALHAVRLADVTLGEHVQVIGLGLIGCLVVQVLQASGCAVTGIELTPSRAAFAREHYGIEVYTPETSTSHEVDAVLVCTTSDRAEPMVQAVDACRKRGRVVLVGTGQIKLDRAQLYEREVTVQVASSYGPGRYERPYEERGLDYPIAHVRWTAQRNMSAVLALMAHRKLDVMGLVQRRANFSDAPALYAHLLDEGETPLAMMLDYEVSGDEATGELIGENVLLSEGLSASEGGVRVGVVGAGVYAQRTFLPALRALDVRRAELVSRGGQQAAWLASREAFDRVGTDVSKLLAAPDIDVVAILTRHDSHAKLASEALVAGKHVFVEKPLARTHEELEGVMACASARPAQLLMVGYNRRFAPMTRTLQRAIAALGEPATVAITVNAGALPAGHWLHDEEQGGRILGEACHFIDLARALIGAPITSSHVQRVGAGADAGALITLGFKDGSAATIAYLTHGPAQLVKERVEVCCASRAASIEGWKRLRVWGWPGLRPELHLRADKGHEAMLHAMHLCVRQGGSPPTPRSEIAEIAGVVIDVARMHRSCSVA